jgi:hypothetical protein
MSLADVSLSDFYNQLSQDEQSQLLQLGVPSGGTVEDFFQSFANNPERQQQILATPISEVISFLGPESGGQISQFINNSPKFRDTINETVPPLEVPSGVTKPPSGMTQIGTGPTVPAGTTATGTPPGVPPTGTPTAHIPSDPEDRVTSVLQQQQERINNLLAQQETQMAELAEFQKKFGDFSAGFPSSLVDPSITDAIASGLLDAINYKPGPGIQKFFDDQRLNREEQLRKQLGPGGLTGSPGIESLRELDEAQILALGGLRQGDINALTNAGTGVANFETSRFNQIFNQRQLGLNELFGRQGNIQAGNQLLGQYMANQGKLSQYSGAEDDFARTLGAGLVGGIGAFFS